MRFDAINRDLFFLPERISYEKYKARLGKDFHEKSSSGIIEISNYLIIEWNRIAPGVVHRLENPLEMKSTFYDTGMKRQSLYFGDGLSAHLFSDLFGKAPDWKINSKSHNISVESNDGKYVIIFNDDSDELNYTLPPYSILLIYKNLI